MIYRRAQNYLNSFINYEQFSCYPYKSSFKLKRLEKLLQFFGNPHKNLSAIHIAGSKGKGSTCIFLANILKASGFKTGLYTSPHLVDVRERIRILQPSDFNLRTSREQMVSQRDFVKIIERIEPYAEKLRETKLGKLSYFEILTACAFLYFTEKKCDFVVLETGLGGRLDATNIVSSLICAITPISYEHTHILGSTLKEIATEKVGIIKDRKQKTENRRQIVVTAPQRSTVLEIIRRRAKEVGATLIEVGKDICIKRKYTEINEQIFNLKGIIADYPGLKIRLLGEHQIVNAAVAVACAESFRFFGIDISQAAIRKGLEHTFWPGRLQVISQRPKIILDAAHNRTSAKALKEALGKFFKFQDLILVFAVSQDKDVRGMLSELEPCASRIILTRAQNPRSLKPEVIQRFIKTRSKSVILTESSAQALQVAQRSAKQDDLILICGSLFLLGEILGTVLRN
jgi:dihydrofolate synthase/folylpolyglutamate synthase